jgi:hypothetical protein
LWIVSQQCIGQNVSPYLRYIDAAVDNLDVSLKTAQTYLDSIPKPHENYISGHLDEFYIIQGHIYGLKNEDAKAFQSFLSALKYSEIDKDYLVAGDANIQLFRCVFPDVNDSISLNYLNQAEHYFKLSNDVYGIYEVELIKSYITYLKEDYYGSILKLLPNLEKYKAVLNEDGYIYMEATAQIALSYLAIDSLPKAQAYFKEFKTTKDNPTITAFNYWSFEASIYFEMAEYFFRQKQLDSCENYLINTKKQLNYLDDTYIASYYELNIDLHKKKKNFDLVETYLDSLKDFQYNMLEINRDASLSINQSINDVESKLKHKNRITKKQKTLIFLLISIVLISSFFYYLFYKKKSNQLKEASKVVDSLSYVKSNNEQLALKMRGFEEYLTHLKNEVKDISSLKCLEIQKTRIKELYVRLHVNSSTILDKSESHLELVNHLNIEFFKNIKEVHPKLNKSEIIICYYLFMGFTNKEIAVFLNTTIRSVESRRYRISKKINLVKTDTTLLDYLQDTFSFTLKSGYK